MGQAEARGGHRAARLELNEARSVRGTALQLLCEQGSANQTVQAQVLQQSKKTVSSGPWRTTFHSRCPAGCSDFIAISVERLAVSTRFSAKSEAFAGSPGK